MEAPDQIPLFVEKDKDLSALDRLFQETRLYRTSAEFREVMEFTKRFRTHAPYNCFLLHMQRPGAEFVANTHYWKKRYNRTIKPGVRPLIILVPFGPVDFVYDVRDTEGDPVPERIVDFFGAKGTLTPGVWNLTKINCEREWIAVGEDAQRDSLAGCIRAASAGTTVMVRTGRTPDGKEIWEKRGAKYAITLNKDHTLVTRYATLVHELAHLYCGHLGTPNEKWWPDRRQVDLPTREFEAESVSWLICERLGIENPSVRYLDGYLAKNREVPKIALELVLKAAGHIERMGREQLKLRKE